MIAPKPPNLFFISCIFIVLLCCCECMPPNSNLVYRNLIDGKGLYDENDKVVIVNSTNFKTTIFGTNNAWVVEFYNSWCGHCFMFAPKWKALAADIYGWRNVVQLAAIDCSTEENNPICRDYDVMGYPTLKFFPAHAPVTAPGTEIQRDSIGLGSPEELERALVGILRKEQVEGRGSTWPNITPLRSSDLAPVQSDATQYVFLVFEEADSSLGTELILDFSYLDHIVIRTVLSDNEALARTLGVHFFPSIVHIPQGHDPELLHPRDSTREDFREALRAFLTAKGVAVPPHIDYITPSELPHPDMAELMSLHHAKTQLMAIKKQGDVVFLADLETALRYMLQHEVPTKKVITGDALIALRQFLTVIAKYFPAGEAGIRYLEQLKNSVQESGSELRGLRFKVLVKETGGGLSSVLATQDGWLGCRGSAPHLRGYPCGVWTLFHFLTVSALRSSDPLEVLNAMLGYITHFFGCTACSQHFQEMAVRSMRAKATDTEQATLWLWSAHNEVNKRLSGALTDDPEFKKVQYPTRRQCPKCHDSAGRWNEPAVLSYLKNKYHQDSLNYQGSNNRVQVAAKKDPPINTRRLVESVVEEQQPTAGRYFNSLDISICIALYGVSGIICAAVCWKFILRRHYRKKAF